MSIGAIAVTDWFSTLVVGWFARYIAQAGAEGKALIALYEKELQGLKGK